MTLSLYEVITNYKSNSKTATYLSVETQICVRGTYMYLLFTLNVLLSLNSGNPTNSLQFMNRHPQVTEVSLSWGRWGALI